MGSGRRLELIEAECRRHAALARVDAAAGPSMRRWRRPWRGRCATSGRRSPYAYR